MARQSNRFEAAFEDYLLSQGLPYISVNENRRSRVKGKPVKNPDFIVTSPRKECALIDVKGKRHPAVSGKRRYWWENWIMAEDIEGLEFWESCFGRSFTALLVFVYEICDKEASGDFADIHSFRGREYGLVAISVRLYSENMKVRSVRWNTRSIPTGLFRRIVRPVTDFI